ncbi:BZ3500_MvSof-1268-A1-R1_Chr10-1g02710 [Microbotryum saponariae]|uniref:Adenine DNA glycosylase n=1 Tax=Microbotryum saponariae TaxID=289078 RepID=A0A2X0N352_9BASI|nr:BZ3500_MvSof-1268-A1-R1_Chr10-1g02710 [Microbotryum saponariae]SDA06199.1 BZ3501_MvSof-1269-A2-R1_Chr10-1g02311 [Microbotryum saponariae]
MVEMRSAASTSSSHPISPLLPAVLGSKTRAHPSSYHCFIDSPYAAASTSTSQSSQKVSKKGKQSASTPALLQGAIPVRTLHQNLLTWFDTVREKRQMPWRKDLIIETMSTSEKTQRAYEVWVSEIMLQQTQVATVIPYFNRWLLAFPTVGDLAKADIEKVNEIWKGLGYYSRANRLLAGAKTVMKQFEGRIPATAEDLERIDGIGPYSAGAISSIAFGKTAAMVDGNVTRVLSRLTAFHGPSTSKATTTYIWALAATLVPPQTSKLPRDYEALSVGGPNKSGSWNQALMELGATICTPKQPKCAECPLKGECSAFAEVRYAQSQQIQQPKSPRKEDVGDIEDLCQLCSPIESFAPRTHDVMQYPMAKERKKPREEETAVCILEWQSEDPKKEKEVLMCKRPEKGLLAGLFEFPSIDLPPSSEASTSTSRRKLLQRLLQTLILDSLPFNASSSSTSTSPLTIKQNDPLPPAVQVYSHMIRTYHPIRIVVTSAQRPRLVEVEPKSKMSKKPPRKKKNGASCSSDEDDDDEDSTTTELIQSIPGRSRWIVASEVENANTGGASDKIWGMRMNVEKGLKALVGSEKGKGGGGKGKGTGKKEKEVVGGGSKREQGLMRNWLVKPIEGGKKRGATKEKEEVKEEEDEVVVMVDEEIKVVESSPGKVYKKRRIVIDSDEEDESILVDVE